jgi:hypothetical protein
MYFVNSDLCHLQHKLIGFITEMKSVYSAVRTGSLNEAVCAPSLKGYGSSLETCMVGAVCHELNTFQAFTLAASVMFLHSRC